jgi:hypothetical protein
MLDFGLNVQFLTCAEEENLLEQLVSFFLVNTHTHTHTHTMLCYHCEDYMAAFDFLTEFPASSSLLIICD